MKDLLLPCRARWGRQGRLEKGGAEGGRSREGPGPLFLLGLVLMLVLALLPAAVPAAAAPAPGMQIYLNDRVLASDQPPANVEGRVMVPFRVLFMALGGSVSWDRATGMVTGRLGNTTVALQPEADFAVVNRQLVALDVGARLINGRTMVPLRFVSESLGAAVQYDAASGTVRISLKAAEGVFLDRRQLQLEPGEAETLTATVLPPDAANRRVRWYSSDPRVARVTMTSETEAVVTPISGGSCVIFVETEDGGFIDTCRVEVRSTPVAVTGLSLSRTTINLSVGQPPTTLRAIIRPDNATNQKVTWTSRTAAVATVHRSGINEGTITPLAPGETLIIAKTEDGGFEATCRVIVDRYAVPVQSIHLSPSWDTRVLSLSSTEYRYITAVLTPRYATNQKILWSVEHGGKEVKDYLSLELESRESGYERVRLVPLKAGTGIRIVAKTEDGNLTASYVLSIVP